MLIIKAKIFSGSPTKSPIVRVVNAKTDVSLSVYHDYRADSDSNCERAIMTFINQLHSDLMCWQIVERVKVGDWHLFVVVTNENVLTLGVV